MSVAERSSSKMAAGQSPWGLLMRYLQGDRVLRALSDVLRSLPKAGSGILDGRSNRIGGCSADVFAGGHRAFQR